MIDAQSRLPGEGLRAETFHLPAQRANAVLEIQKKLPVTESNTVLAECPSVCFVDANFVVIGLPTFDAALVAALRASWVESAGCLRVGREAADTFDLTTSRASVFSAVTF